MRILVLLILMMPLTSCQRTLPRKQITASEFSELYRNPMFNEYRGIEDGNHILVHKTFKPPHGSLIRPCAIYEVPVSDVPQSILTTSQDEHRKRINQEFADKFSLMGSGNSSANKSMLRTPEGAAN